MGQWHRWVNMNKGSASNYWFDDNKRFEPVANTVTKAIQNTVYTVGIIETEIGP